MKFQYMKKRIIQLGLLLVLTFHFSCEVYDEDVVELIGTYEGHITGLSGPFSFNISYGANDELFVEAPLNGFDWSIVSIDIDQEEQQVKNINVSNQSLESDSEIWGDGFYVDKSMQIDYIIRSGNLENAYTLVGTKN